MHLHILLCLSVCGLCSAFFLFHEKEKPPIFCYKICPLYCPKHPKASKRYDQDASFLTYNNPYTIGEGSAKYDYFASTNWKSKTPKTTKAPPKRRPVYSDLNPFEDGSGDYDSSEYEHWEPKPQTITDAPETTTELIYLDHNPYAEPEGSDYPSHYWRPKPTPKTTTKATTTEKPIYFDHKYHNPYHTGPEEYDYDPPHFWKLKTTSTKTTTEATTTENPIYLDHNPYHTGPEEYDYSPPRYWKPKPTSTTTTTKKMTEKEVYIDHNPYFTEEWLDYEYDVPTHYYSWKPKPTTTPTTTEAPTSTEEPTFICQVCKAKCDHKT